MTETIKQKQAKWLVALLITLICIILMTAGADAAGANGGTGALDGSVGSENDYSEGAVRYNDPVLTATGGDAWEVSLYIGGSNVIWMYNNLYQQYATAKLCSNGCSNEKSKYYNFFLS